MRPVRAREVHHIGHAVADLDAAVGLYGRLLGGAVEHRGAIADQGVEAAAMRVGTSLVELVAPLGDDTPVGRFLAKRGPGMHHVAYQTSDIEATLRMLKHAGLRLIDETPRTGIRQSRVAFLHPSASGGVLTEIVQPAEVHV